MRQALHEAAQAAGCGEVPVGAVIVAGGKVIGRGRNRMEELRDATKHAEIQAIQEASRKLDNWRLDGAALFVTLEPCSMCIGAILLSRIEELYFGCYDPRQGAVGSLFDLSNHPGMPHAVQVYPEVLAAECSAQLKDFFAGLRND